MLVDCNAEALTITVDDARRVSGLLQVPVGARICLVLAHGAGAGMSHPFMAGIADGPLLALLAGTEDAGPMS
jgi:hypothetical protein